MVSAGKLSPYETYAPISAACALTALTWYRAAWLGAIVSLGLLTAASVSAEPIDGCTNTSDLTGVIADCTKIIESDWATNRQVRLAFNNRAGAHELLGDHNAAIDDYSRALDIDPHYVTALYN